VTGPIVTALLCVICGVGLTTAVITEGFGGYGCDDEYGQIAAFAPLRSPEGGAVHEPARL
jgi:hypothetical protein